MASALDDLFAKALALPDEDRAELARLLLLSLESGEADDGVEEALAREVERRVADLHAGRAKTIEWEELRARLQARASRS
jgi:putative addiction module component (TIGR02574 family)